MSGAAGTYIRDDGAVMHEVESHQHVNEQAAIHLGLIADPYRKSAKAEAEEAA
jgi:hypothetical protein